MIIIMIVIISIIIIIIIIIVTIIIMTVMIMIIAIIKITVVINHHRDHNAPSLYPTKFYITIFSNFSWVLPSSQEKLKNLGVSSHYGPVKMVNVRRAERVGFLNENNFAKLRKKTGLVVENL